MADIGGTGTHAKNECCTRLQKEFERARSSDILNELGVCTVRNIQTPKQVHTRAGIPTVWDSSYRGLK